MNSGEGQLLTVGNTIVSEHMALNDHSEGDIEISLLGFEPNWKKRLIKETIAINKHKPNLNGTEGFHLSAIYDPLPTSLTQGTRLASHNDVISFERRSHSRASANQHSNGNH